MSKAKGAELVTEEELRALPRLACVAFADRCARRVEPLYQMVARRSAPGNHAFPLQGAAAMSELFAVRATADNALTAALDALVARAAALATLAALAARDARSADTPATHAALTVHAAHAAYAAHAAALVVVGSSSVDAAVLVAMRLDYESLLTVAKSENWSHSTAVSPEFFGPSWPNGEPEHWLAAANDEPIEIVIDVEVPDGDAATVEQANQCLGDLINEMDRMHRSLGGGGLKITSVEVEDDGNTPGSKPS